MTASSSNSITSSPGGNLLPQDMGEELCSAPSTPLKVPSLAMLCLRCGEETSIADSYPSSAKNPLKRIDRGCSNVDKCLNRRCGPDTKAKKARTEPKPEHVLRSEAEHRALREKMKSMPEAERQNWYKEQKKQQGEEDAMSKRRLTDTSASINQLNDKSLSKVDVRVAQTSCAPSLDM